MATRDKPWAITNSQSYSQLNRVKIPADLEPGQYVLSWRWDVVHPKPEVFAQCANIEITSGGLPPAPMAKLARLVV